MNRPRTRRLSSRPRRHARRGLRAVLGISAAALAAAPAAHAEYRTITVQAQRAHADWLAFAPSPNGGAAAVCLVDTGVDLNPDTQGNVVDQSSLDGGPVGDGGSDRHGTLMAMTMGAPINGWGMVGGWPQVKIVDVRAVDPGTKNFQYGNYRLAINSCRAKAAAFNVKVINLSIAGDPAAPSDDDRAKLADRVDGARAAGINVVAAAGNDGGPVNAPGNYASVFTIAAGDRDGALCSFASRGPEIDLLAPGCELDGAFPDGSPAINASGSSQASAFTSAVIAAMRSYEPTLTVDQAETALLTTADHGVDGPALNVEAAFDSIGLSDVVTRAKAAEAAALSPPTPQPTGGGGSGGGSAGATATASPAAPVSVSEPSVATQVHPPVPPSTLPSSTEALPKPRARRLQHTRRGWRLALSNRPDGALAILTVYARSASPGGRRARFAVTRRRVLGSHVLIRRKSWDHITVRYRDGFAPDSPTLTIRTPRPARSNLARHPDRRGPRAGRFGSGVPQRATGGHRTAG